MWGFFFSEARAILKENEQHLQACKHFAFLFFFTETLFQDRSSIYVYIQLYIGLMIIPVILHS